jgi:WD40 repeat protein
MPEGKPAQELPMPAGGANGEADPHTLAFSRDARTLAALRFDRSKDFKPEIVRWDLGRRAVTARVSLRGFKRIARSQFTFSPDLSWFAAADAPGIIGIWDVATGAEVAALKGYSPSERLSGVPIERQPWENVDCAFAPDGKTFAASFAWQDYIPFSPEQLGDKMRHPPDNRIKLWDTGAWKERRTIAEAGRASSHGLAFTPDSALLVGGRSHLRLWAAATGRERLALPMPERFCCRFAAGEDLVCVGAPGGDVMVWDRESKLERAFQHPLYSDSPSLTTVLSAALSPDGRALALVAVRQTGIVEDRRSTLVLLSIPPPRSKAPR